MTSVLRRSRTTLPVLAALAGLLCAVPASAGNANSAQRAFARCQQTVAREGLSYTSQMQWRLSRCVRTLGDCSAGNQGSCRMSPFACRSTANDLSSLEAGFVRSVVGSCGDVPVPTLMSAGFAPGMQSCAPGSADAFARCVAANLRHELGDMLEQVMPAACTLLANAGITVPAELCAGPVPCVTTSTVTTTTEATTSTEAPTTTTSTSTTTTTIPAGSALYCGGDQGVACPDGMVCDRSDPLCSQGSVPGMCVTPAAVCDTSSPVCGCDGLTYASDCDRVKAGAVKARAGACDPTPQACSFSNPTCPQGQFCDFVPGDCGEGGDGVCRPMRGEPCNLCEAFVVGPVCGCNMQVYASECERMAAGVAKLWNGACQ